MHKLTTDLYLEPITIAEYQELYDLMCKIYPPAYAHLWPDKGASYINSIYAKENLGKELGQLNSEYFFITYKNEKAGILKVLLNESLPTAPYSYWNQTTTYLFRPVSARKRYWQNAYPLD